MSIVYTTSDETGAPVLNNTPGSLDALLHAVLVTGWRVQSPSSVVVAAEVATVTLASHGYSDGRIVELAGATPAGLNGRKRIAVTGANTFTFAAAGVADGAASGAITTRRASLGWARPLSSGGVSIYTRTDVQATAMALRVDDSGSGAAGATFARWRMVESYSDLNTFTGPTPPAAVYGGSGHYIPKGADTAAAKPWVLVGDGRTLYLFTDAQGYSASSYGGVPQGLWMFGDFNSFRAGDAYGCAIAGAQASSTVDSQGLGSGVALGIAPPSHQVMVARPFNGVGAPVRAAMVGHGGRAGGQGPHYPSPVDNGLSLHVGPLLSEENSPYANPLRGQLRGVGVPLSSIGAGLLHLQVLDNLIGSDRRWLFVGFQQQGSYGHLAFDVTGPW